MFNVGFEILETIFGLVSVSAGGKNVPIHPLTIKMALYKLVTNSGYDGAGVEMTINLGGRIIRFSRWYPRTWSALSTSHRSRSD
jgi:hypothetical protein